MRANARRAARWLATVDYWYQYAGTGTWHPEQVATLSPGQRYFDPSMASAGGSVVITDSDGSDFPGGDLDYWWQQDGATGWNHQQVTAG
jgi:hypothetical protein